MVNEEILKLGQQLKNVVDEQMKQAKNALSNLPEGQTKSELEALLKRAASGSVSPQQAQKEVQKIIDNARKN